MRGDTLLLRNADLLCTMNPADSSDPPVRAGDNVGAEIRNGGPVSYTHLTLPTRLLV